MHIFSKENKRTAHGLEVFYKSIHSQQLDVCQWYRNLQVFAFLTVDIQLDFTYRSYAQISLRKKMYVNVYFI